MLSPTFLNWWYSPWENPVGALGTIPFAQNVIAKRDFYPIWCRQAGVRPDIPARFDAGWCFIAELCSDSLIGSAKLFAGLMAARAKDFAALNFLTPEDRKWCISVAQTQPSQAMSDAHLRRDNAAAALIDGLREIVMHLEENFPGLWSRLRLHLPSQIDADLAAAMLLTQSSSAATMFSNNRAQRCWRMCVERYRYGTRDVSALNFLQNEES